MEKIYKIEVIRGTEHMEIRNTECKQAEREKTWINKKNFNKINIKYSF